MPGIDRGKICVFGAGGAVGACVYRAMGARYAMRFTDIRPAEEIFGRQQEPGGMPVWEGAPEAPHEWRACDVTDFGQVCEAMEGCDAAINLVVNRGEPALAFRLNVGGTYHIMKAAARAGLKRVIHTGVWARVNGYEGDYRYDYALPDDIPTHAGTTLYPLTKSLGLDVADAFAREEGLDVITLLLSRIRPREARDGRDGDVMISYSVSFEDLGRAYLAAMRAPVLPRPNERFFICAELPMEKYLTEKAERLLGWRAMDTFGRFYRRGWLDQ